MKLYALLIILSAAWIIEPLPSTVIHWDEVKPSAGASRQFLRGSTDVLAAFDVTGETLDAQARVLPSAIKGSEELIIIKEGKLIVTIGQTTQQLEPGGVAYIMGGDTRSYSNPGRTPASYYRLRFRAAKPDDARGKKGGPSFMRNWDELEKKATDKGFRREVFDRPTAMCADFEMHVTTLNAGVSSHAPHTHAQEEIILLLQGKAEMEIDGKRHPIAPGSLCYVATLVPHALHNVGDGEAEYFAFQWK